MDPISLITELYYNTNTGGKMAIQCFIEDTIAMTKNDNYHFGTNDGYTFKEDRLDDLNGVTHRLLLQNDDDSESAYLYVSTNKMETEEIPNRIVDFDDAYDVQVYFAMIKAAIKHKQLPPTECIVF